MSEGWAGARAANCSPSPSWAWSPWHRSGSPRLASTASWPPPRASAPRRSAPAGARRTTVQVRALSLRSGGGVRGAGRRGWSRRRCGTAEGQRTQDWGQPSDLVYCWLRHSCGRRGPVRRRASCVGAALVEPRMAMRAHGEQPGASVLSAMGTSTSAAQLGLNRAQGDLSSLTCSMQAGRSDPQPNPHSAPAAS